MVASTTWCQKCCQDDKHKSLHPESKMAEINDPPPKILQHVPFPEKIILKDDASRKKDWEIRFQQIWENYEIYSQLKDYPKRRRMATLLTHFSPSARKVYNSLSFDNETR